MNATRAEVDAYIETLERRERPARSDEEMDLMACFLVCGLILWDTFERAVEKIAHNFYVTR